MQNRCSNISRSYIRVRQPARCSNVVVIVANGKNGRYMSQGRNYDYTRTYARRLAFGLCTWRLSSLRLASGGLQRFGFQYPRLGWNTDVVRHATIRIRTSSLGTQSLDDHLEFASDCLDSASLSLATVCSSQAVVVFASLVKFSHAN